MKLLRFKKSSLFVDIMKRFSLAALVFCAGCTDSISSPAPLVEQSVVVLSAKPIFAPAADDAGVAFSVPSQFPFYGRRFEEVSEYFMENDVPAMLPGQYAERFSLEEISRLIINEIHPNLANDFDLRFDIDDIVSFVRFRILPEGANAYSSRFDSSGICGLIYDGCPPDVAEKYSPDIHPFQISICYRSGLLPEFVNRYTGLHGAYCLDEELEFIAKARVPPEYVNGICAVSFPKGALVRDGELISKAYEIGLSLDTVQQYAKEGKSLLDIIRLEKNK